MILSFVENSPKIRTLFVSHNLSICELLIFKQIVTNAVQMLYRTDLQLTQAVLPKIVRGYHIIRVAIPVLAQQTKRLYKEPSKVRVNICDNVI